MLCDKHAFGTQFQLSILHHSLPYKQVYQTHQLTKLMYDHKSKRTMYDESY